MAHYSGSALYIKWIYASAKGLAAAGTVEPATDYRSLTVNRGLKTIDTTAGSDQYEGHIQSHRSANGQITFIAENGSGTAFRKAFYEGAYGTLEWAPEGTATGKPKHSIKCSIEKMDETIPYDNAVEFTINWKGDEAWITDFNTLASVY